MTTDLRPVEPRWGSFVECLRAHAAERPEALALYELAGLREVRKALSFSALDRRARAVAARLQSLGAAGQRVLLVLDNDLHYLIAFLGCGYAGSVAVNLLPPKKPKHMARIAHVARDCDASVVLLSRRLAASFQAEMGAEPGLEGLSAVAAEDIAESEAQGYAPTTPDTQDLCFIQYTSGSTGTPRGVMVSHNNLMMNCATMQRLFGLGTADHAINWMPLYHDLGLIIGHLLPLYCGFPSGLSDPLSFIKHPDRWLRAIFEQGATFAGGPNFAYDLCLDAIDPRELEGVDLSRWRAAYNGAEHVRSRTVARFNETYAPFGLHPTTVRPTYGLAEFTLVVSTRPGGTLPSVRDLDAEALARGEIRDRAEGARCVTVVSSGQPGPGTEIRIVDPDTGLPVAADRVGEIWVAGASVARGYWGKSEASEYTFRATLPGDPRAWLRTGDLGFLDGADLYITGRSKDVIIIAGVNHYPQDIEETVERTHAAIRPNFVMAFADEVHGEEVLVVVAELRRGEAEGLDLASLADPIFRAIAREHEITAREVHFVHHGQVPKTTSGKLQRSHCRALLRAGQLEIHGSFRRGGAR